MGYLTSVAVGVCIRLSVLICLLAIPVGCGDRKPASSELSSPPVFAPQQMRPKPPPPEERETKVLPLDSDNCTGNDTTIIDSTTAQLLARCETAESTTRVLLTMVPRTTDPADHLREFSLRFCGDVIDTEAPSGWKTTIQREKGHTSVAADVTWTLQEAALQSSTARPGRIVGFAVSLRGRWQRGLGYSVAFSKSIGPIALSPHDCPYSTVPSPSSGALSKMAPAAAPPSSAQQASADCVRAPMPLRKVRDRKPDESDLRGIRTHGGVLVFDIRIGASGKVEDVRLVKPVGQEAPWPILAERWRTAISEWRYEPPTLNNKPVAVCLTISIIVHVE